MKILHILNSIDFSGAEIMLKTSGPFFSSIGFELHALSTGDNIGRFANHLRGSCYTVHHIPFKKSFIYFFKLYRFIDKYNFDIVHIHPERAFFWHSFVSKIAGVNKIIRTVHNNFHFSGYLRFKRIFQRFIASKFIGLIFISISPLVYETEQYFFYNDSIMILNWVNHDIFFPIKNRYEFEAIRNRHRIPLNDIVIISVGSCIEVKNHIDILVAFYLLRKTIDNITYIHTGDGPLRSHENDLAMKLGISDKVLFLDQVNNENVRELLIASDIYVMPSNYEGFSISKIEAMFCGLPLVVYDNIGVRDFIEEGKNGFLVNPNPFSMSEAIKILINNESLRKAMGKNARFTALHNFDMNKSINKLKNIYEL